MYVVFDDPTSELPAFVGYSLNRFYDTETGSEVLARMLPDQTVVFNRCYNTIARNASHKLDDYHLRAAIRNVYTGRHQATDATRQAAFDATRFWEDAWEKRVARRASDKGAASAKDAFVQVSSPEPSAEKA